MRSFLSRMIPERLAPFFLMLGGRPASAGQRLADATDLPTRDDVAALEARVAALEAELEQQRRELGAAVSFFDRAARSE